MDIRKRLEEGQSKPLTMAIAQYVGVDKKRFKELADVFFKGDYVVMQRAAWPVGDILVQQPQLITPYYARLVKLLDEPGHHVAVARNILRAFQEADMPEQYQGPVLDNCLRFMVSEAQPAAIRAFAITVAANISRHYAELQKELRIVLEELARMQQQPAIAHRVKAALKVLK